MGVELNEVYAAIDALYNNGPDQVPENQTKASQWLYLFQKSIEAWKISDQILHQKRDLNSCFFAAQTLRTKIQFHFSELPSTAHESLHGSVLQHLEHVCEGTNPGIATQISVAVADMALLMTGWGDPIGDLIKKFGADCEDKSKKNFVCLLEVLTALPEELNSHKFNVGKARRENFRTYCTTNIPKVIKLLDSISKNGDVYLMRVLRCLSSWFNLHSEHWDQISNTNLLNLMTVVVSSSNVPSKAHEIAADCVCSALIMLESIRLPTLADALFGAVLQLEQPYHDAVAAENVTAVSDYVRIFAEFGETLVENLIKEPQSTSTDKVMNIMLVCVRHHEWEVAEITFTFWYKLSEILFKINNDATNRLFQKYVMQLLDALYRHCQIDCDHEGLLKPIEDFSEFRQRAKYLVQDVAFIVHSGACFDAMSGQLQQQDTAWNLLEAALFIMGCVARNLVVDPNPVVERVLDLLVSQQPPGHSSGAHVQVAQTSLKLITELTEYLSCNPRMLHPVITFCTALLRNESLAKDASTSLQALCKRAQQHMAPHIEELMTLVSSLIHAAARTVLYEGVANVVNTLCPDEMRERCETLCYPHAQNLNRILLMPDYSKVTQRGHPDDPIVWLNMLTAILRKIDSEQQTDVHPCTNIVLQLWPLISQTMDKFSEDYAVVEHCCRTLRFAVRCVKQNSAPILSELISKIVQLYGKAGHSCYLYLGSIFVDEFGSSAQYTAVLLQMLEAFTPKTFEILTKENGFKNSPDTVEDWFRLCTRYLQRCPAPILQSQVLDSIVQCGVQAALLDHKEANSCVLKFFQDMLQVALRSKSADDYDSRLQLVEAVYSKYTGQLVTNLITASVYVLPQYMLREVAETLLQLSLFNPARLHSSLSSTLSNLPRTSSNGTTAVTEAQVLDLLQLITSSRKTEHIKQGLYDFSRCYT